MTKPLTTKCDACAKRITWAESFLVRLVKLCESCYLAETQCKDPARKG